jgi:ribosomal protein S18 acetylase RimI-like enzyme
MQPGQDYRLLTLTDVEPAARVMAEAYRDDPLCCFLLPNDRTRVKTMVKFFRALGEVSIQNRRVYGAGQPLQGVAYWNAPGQADVSVSLRSLGKFLPLLFTGYPRGYLRAQAIFRQTEALHQKHADQPHYYLDNIGVLAAARGKGLASHLIRPILEQADAQGVIAYTDTVTPSNVGLYQHFGFECVEQSAVPETGITVFALRRPVRPG